VLGAADDDGGVDDGGGAAEEVGVGDADGDDDVAGAARRALPSSAGPQPVRSTSSASGAAQRRRTGPQWHVSSPRRPTLGRMFPGGAPDLSQLMQQAQQMQQQLVAAQEELAHTEVTGSAGGHLVTATMTGTGELTALTISPAAVDPDDLETLQDLVVAAVRDAKRAADELTASRMGPLAGGLGGLGGGLGLPGLP
jgi:DNA-binding YbaB/EbfC family protein